MEQLRLGKVVHKYLEDGTNEHAYPHGLDTHGRLEHQQHAKWEADDVIRYKYYCSTCRHTRMNNKV